MANRYLRGTFVRNAWDFYELGAAFVYGNYNAPAAPIGFVFINNGVAQSYLDVFRVEISLATPSALTWRVVPPGAVYTSVEPSLYFNAPVQLDISTPPGDMAVFTSPASNFNPAIKSRADSVTYDSIELANGGPFLTLPPLYGLAVNFDLSAPGLVAMSVWYQSLTDHTPPAM